MSKAILTPGKLYAKLGAEFRRLRPAGCESCVMPMLYAIERVDGDYANWMVENAGRACDDCKSLIADIVCRFSFEYDVYDPAFTTRAPRPGLVASSSIPPHRLHSF
jgi:hypothetical protein